MNSKQRHATAAVSGKVVNPPNSAGIVLLSKKNVNPFSADKAGILRVLMVYDKTRRQWTIPAGKREHKSSAWHTAKKEFAEETGVRWGVLPDMPLTDSLDVAIGKSGQHSFRAYVFRADERLAAIENSIGPGGARLTHQGTGKEHYETDRLYWAAINKDGTFEKTSLHRMGGRVFAMATLREAAKKFPVLFV